MVEIISHPDGNQRLGDLLLRNLESSEWTTFRAAVAFAKRSGTKHIVPALTKFSASASVAISLGIDHCGTSFEGANDLLAAVSTSGQLWIFHNDAASRPTFHPKIYLFSNRVAAEAFIGSGNLTEGGLFTNYEAFVHLRLDRLNPDGENLLKQLEDLLDVWTSPEEGTARKADDVLLAELRARGDLLSEAEISRLKRESVTTIKQGIATRATDLFASVPVKPAPRVRSAGGARSGSVITPLASKRVIPSTGFCITLQNTDVGVGQKTAGAARRSAELFIPKVCVRANPEFWGWPGLFVSDPKYQGPPDGDGFGKMDRPGVRMRLGPTVLTVNWWYNPDKRDYRMRNEALRSAGNIGDILRIESASGEDGFDYYVEIIPKGTSQFEKFAAICTERVRNSLKKWGYY